MAKAEGKGAINRFEITPLILTTKTRSDMISVLRKAGKGRGAVAGVDRIASFFEMIEQKGKTTKVESPYGVALVEYEGGNKVAVVIFTDVTDLRNGELYEKHKDKLLPVPLNDVGKIANASDITKPVNKWNKFQELKIKKGTFTELGEYDLGISFTTFRGAGDPPDIYKSMNEGLIGRWKKMTAGAKPLGYLHLKGIPVWVFITKFEAKNLIMVSVFFDDSNLRNADRFDDQKKIGLTLIPVDDIGPTTRWSDITGNVMKIYSSFDKKQEDKAKQARNSIKKMKLKDNEELEQLVSILTEELKAI